MAACEFSIHHETQVKRIVTTIRDGVAKALEARPDGELATRAPTADLERALLQIVVGFERLARVEDV